MEGIGRRRLKRGLLQKPGQRVGCGSLNLRYIFKLNKEISCAKICNSIGNSEITSNKEDPCRERLDFNRG